MALMDSSVLLAGTSILHMLCQVLVPAWSRQEGYLVWKMGHCMFIAYSFVNS